MKNLALALHGGSGTILRKNLTSEREAAYRDALRSARETGWKILVDGGTALDAVEAVVRMLEDCPLFNAGRGSVFTNDGRHEMDAAIMCGQSRKAGAVAGLREVRYPVSLARAVMEKTNYVFLSGEGLQSFAAQQRAQTERAEFFYTDERWKQLQAAKHEGAVVMDHDASDDKKFGTVGAVALDAHGNIAAATSTGGLTNKSFGRIGDSPVIGSGTYACNRTCAVSCTGYGEEFIRAVVAHDVAARMEYLSESLSMAARAVVMDRLPVIGGEGGLIACDAQGNIALTFNTDGMYRAWQTNHESGCAIFRDEG